MTRMRLLKYAILLSSLVIGLVLAFGPVWVTPDTNDVMRIDAAQRSLAIFVVCMALWPTNSIPVAATGLLAGRGIRSAKSA